MSTDEQIQNLTPMQRETEMKRRAVMEYFAKCMHYTEENMPPEMCTPEMREKRKNAPLLADREPARHDQLVEQGAIEPERWKAISLESRGNEPHLPQRLHGQQGVRPVMSFSR